MIGSKYKIILALAVCVFPVCSMAAQESIVVQEVCDDDKLQEAGRAYDLGRFEEVVWRLRPCLENSFSSKEQNKQAYRLATLAHFELDNRDASRDLIDKLLKVDRKYQALSGDPHFFQAQLDAQRPKALIKKPWFWVGAAALVSGGVYLLTRPSGGLPELPGPPSDPPPPR